MPDVDGDVLRDVLVLFPFKELAQDILCHLSQRRSILHVLPDRPPRPVVGRHELGFVLGRVHGQDLGGSRVPQVVPNKAITLPSATSSPFFFCQRSREVEEFTNRYPVKGKHKDKYVSRRATNARDKENWSRRGSKKREEECTVNGRDDRGREGTRRNGASA